MKKLPVRKVIRLPHFDYSGAHSYFITVCAYQKACLFSRISGKRNPRVCLTPIGSFVRDQILCISEKYPSVSVDRFIVMPNHVHMILRFLPTDNLSAPSLPDVMRSWKAQTSFYAKRDFGAAPLFQRSYYEHIIRNREDRRQCALYILYNPINWRFAASGRRSGKSRFTGE